MGAIGGPGSNQYGPKPRPRPPIDPPRAAAAKVAGAMSVSPLAGGTGQLRGRVSDANLTGHALLQVSFDSGPTVHASRFDHADAAGHPGVFGLFTSCSFHGFRGAAANLDGHHIGSDFTDADLQLAVLPSAYRCEFTKVDLRLSSARRRSFDHCVFTGARWDGARFSGCTFRGADLTGGDGLELAVFRACLFDDRTRFPQGYQPAEHGWIRDALDADQHAALEDLHARAMTGDLVMEDLRA